MAFTTKEKEIIQFGKANGKTQREVEQALIKYRTGTTTKSVPVATASTGKNVAPPEEKQPGYVSRVVSGVQQTKENLDSIRSEFRGKGVESNIVGAAKSVSEVAQAVVSPVTEALRSLASYVPKIPYAKEVKDELGNFIKTATKPEVDALEAWTAEHPELAKHLSTVLEVAKTSGDVANVGLVAEGVGALAKTGVAVTKEIPSVVGKVGSATADTVKAGATRVGEMLPDVKTTLFGKSGVVESIDDVVKQADAALKPSEVLAKTTQTTAKPSLMERWAGVSNDIKNRIKGKAQKLQEYFDVAHARNNYDTLPTPLEYGAKNVENAATKMQSLLDDTGGQIGQFRQKIGTYKASPDAVKAVEGSFNEQLSKLNLEVRNGAIRQKPGTVTRVNSSGEIKVLNDLYGDLQTVKQSPDLQRLIDLRTLFDNKINFAKSARDVSSSLDPLSRAIRKQIADTAAGIVGKSEAANLTKYSEFIDALNELKSFTDRKAGAEFLLKQVLSDRGGTPRQVIQTIKDFTGIDLMDDAVMSSLATDLIGNSRQKGLFRQELTKAGLDAAALMRGDPTGAIQLMMSIGKKALVNEEKQFLNAAK